MRPLDGNTDSLGAEVYRLPFAVQGARRFVVAIFGGLTVMVGLWASLMLGSSALTLEKESSALFVGVLGFFVVLIVAGFSVTWLVLSRYPRALVVRERAVVLEHGPRTRVMRFDEVRGVERRDMNGKLTYLVLLEDGGEVPFGIDHDSREAARVLVERAGLACIQEPSVPLSRDGSSGSGE